MLHVIAGVGLATLLLASAALKLAAPRSSAAALATFGVRGAAPRWAAWGALVAAELGLAVAVGAGVDLAARLAAALMVAFAAAQAWALARGRRGAPCACFGARSTVSPLAVARNLILAAAFAVLPLVPHSSVGAETWLAVAVGALAVVVAVLTVAVLALAREVGVLRMAIGPQQALEIPDEGPPLGEPAPLLLERAAPGPGARLALAVFSSEGCRLCQAVAPAVAMLAREPELAVVALDEVRDADAWRAAAVPGSPYAVALDPRDGTVLAKGTFNGLGQLESVLATAERRAREAEGAERRADGDRMSAPGTARG